MEAIGFGQCVKGAWRDGWRYVQHRPGLVTLMFVLVWMASFVEGVLKPDRRPPFRVITYVPLGAFELVKIALLATLTVHALRFVLLGAREADSEPLFGRNYWRYLGLIYVLCLFVLALAAIGFGLGAGVVWLLAARHHLGSPILIPALIGLGMLVAMCVGFFLLMRLSLLSTHVAIGGGMRIRAAWADTRGHCWSIWLTQMAATLPMLAVSGVAMLCEVAARRHGIGGINAISGAIVGIASVFVSAGCGAWLYLRYAAALAAQP
ncbi:hypothetical protein WJ542_27630 [Paraburkholderia sp. B3]|uniref:hypothetical protein n=1 Tax=Paraburkholderia sp. B3 TaxID=3134791 RepID=UPI003981BE2D